MLRLLGFLATCSGLSLQGGSQASLQLDADRHFHHSKNLTSPSASGIPRHQVEHDLDARASHNATFGDLELVALPSHSDPTSDTFKLMREFRVCANCKDLKRFGPDHDGGYAMCMKWDSTASGQEADLSTQRIGAIYSFGVSRKDGWSTDIAALFAEAPVHLYDCTVDPPANICTKCEFHKSCVKGKHTGGIRGKSNQDLGQILKSTGQGSAPSGSLLMKMDVESSEWAVLKDADPADLTKFAQIIIEFHGLSNKARHAEFFGTVRRLRDSGFSVGHIHGNNCCGTFEEGGYHVASVLEVTFVANAAELGHCHSRDFLKSVDSINVPKNNDVNAEIVLPAS